MLMTCSNMSCVAVRCAGVSPGLAGAPSAAAEAAASRKAATRRMGESPDLDFGDTLGCVSAPSILVQAVPLAEIVGALHFLEPARRSVEFEPSVALRVQVCRLCIGGHEQLHPMLIEC